MDNITNWFFPVPLLAFAGGMGFGLWYGSLLTFIGASLNLSVMFYISRYLFRDSIQRYLFKKYPSTVKILTTNQKRLKISLMLARFMPLIPYNMENYAYGLTDISFWDYLWISLLCILPGTFIYVNVGDKALEPSQADFMVAIGLLVVLVFGTAIFGKYFKDDSNQSAN